MYPSVYDVFIYNYLYIRFIHFVKKILDSIFILAIVHHDKSDMSSCNESTDKPLIELVDDF